MTRARGRWTDDSMESEGTGEETGEGGKWEVGSGHVGRASADVGKMAWLSRQTDRQTDRQAEGDGRLTTTSAAGFAECGRLSGLRVFCGPGWHRRARPA